MRFATPRAVAVEMKKLNPQHKRSTGHFGKSQRLTICFVFFLLVACAATFEVFPGRYGRDNADAVITSRTADHRYTLVSSEGVSPTPKVTAQVVGFLEKTEFGQFPAQTEAERELEKMLRGKDEDINLATANWLIVRDIPQFADLTRDTYFKQLDAMSEQVRHDMARMQDNAKVRGKDLNAPEFRCGTFCNAAIKLKFSYIEEFARHDLTSLQYKGLYGDANNIFLAGLNRTRRGSCVSMPLIYMVLGQRFGLPVHLVHVGRHFFVRWEEPGCRLNIETTAVDKVWVTDDDSAYLDEEGMTRDQVSGNELRNLTNREIVANLFFIRSSHWAMRAEKSRSKSWVDLSRAFRLSPEDPAIAKTYRGIFAQYGLGPESTFSDLRSTEAKVLKNEANTVIAEEWSSASQRPQEKRLQAKVDRSEPNARLGPKLDGDAGVRQVSGIRASGLQMPLPVDGPNNVPKGNGHE